MKAQLKKAKDLIISRVLNKKGAFLLEAMIGTAILSIVLVFFATVSVSAFMMMHRAYKETQITEDVFLRVESRKYTDPDPAETLHLSRSLTPVSGGDQFVMGSLGIAGSEEVYVSYVASDGSVEGALEESDLSLATLSAKALFVEEIYAIRYEKEKEGYAVALYILKGEK